MARCSDPKIKATILDGCAKTVLRTGMRECSLSGLSKGRKVSRRMLIYHFGTAQQLIEETISHAVGLLRARHQALLAQENQEEKGDIRKTLLAFWRQSVTPEMEQSTRAYFSLYAASLGSPGNTTIFAEFNRPGWLGWAKSELAGSTQGLTDTEITLVFGVIRGLLLDYWASKDLVRTTAALEKFLARIIFEHDPTP